MSDETANMMLSIIEDMVESDREITMASLRLLGSPFRENYLSMRERNRHALASAMLITMSARQAHEHRQVQPRGQTITMNIPLTIPPDWNEPVRVIPNVDQLNTGIERNHVLSEAVTCSICQEEMSTNTANVSRLRHCHHCFHDGCIRDWFLMSSRCPVCRNDIRERPATNTNTNNETPD